METDKEIMEEMEREAAPAQEPVPEPVSPVTPPVNEPPVDEPPIPEPPAEVKTKKTFLRDSRSWTDIIPIAAMLSLLVLELGALLSTILMNRFIPVYRIGLSLLDDIDSVDFLLQYFSFFGIWIFFLLVALVFKDNWPMLKAFFYNRHGNNLKSIPAGILLGFGMNGFCVLMSCIMGDIKLSFSGFNPVAFFAFLFCVMIQSGAEEIVDRCYLYQKLRRRAGSSAGIPLRRPGFTASLLLGQPMGSHLDAHGLEFFPEYCVWSSQQRYCVQVFCLQARGGVRTQRYLL